MRWRARERGARAFDAECMHLSAKMSVLDLVGLDFPTSVPSSASSGKRLERWIDGVQLNANPLRSNSVKIDALE